MEPDAKRGKLRHGNPSGDPNASPRCGAMAKPFQRRKRAGGCQQPGMRLPSGEYTRCRLHGGAGAIANWKHGRYSAQTRAEAAEIAELLSQAKTLTDETWDKITASAGLPPPQKS